MMEEWSPLGGEDAKKVIEDINALNPRPYFDEKTTRLKTAPLSFYGSAACVLKATEYAAHPPMSMRFLFIDGKPVKLDRSKDPILSVNERISLVLSENTVSDYVRFFFSVVDSDEGAFQIVDTLEDISFSEEPDEDLTEKLDGAIEPLRLLSEENGRFVLAGTLLYARCLYSARIEVSLDGDVDIAEEDALFVDLPVRRLRLK